MAPVKKKVHLNVDLGEGDSHRTSLEFPQRIHTDSAGYGNFKCGPDEELIPMIDHVRVFPEQGSQGTC